MRLGDLAVRALEGGQALELPAGATVPRVRIEDPRSPGMDAPEAAGRIADAVWQARGGGRFDGRLLGALEGEWADGTARFGCAPIRYRDFLATDELLRAHPAAPPPLAMGVHAILECEGKWLCLRTRSGTLGLPGGAVDEADALDGGEDALAHALVRETREETGLEVERGTLRPEGIWLGGSPTHLIFLLSAPIGAPQAAEVLSSGHDAGEEDIAGAELVSVADLAAHPMEKSLVLRLALQRPAGRR